VDAATFSDYISKVRADLEQAVSTAYGRTPLISGEDISALRRDALVKLRDYLQERFNDVTFVGYVRAPAGLMSSTFQHRIGFGLVDHFDLETEYRSYKWTFAKFHEVFGRERVNLWKFDIGRFPGGCAVRGFCARLGIALPPERILRLKERVAVAAGRRAALYLLQGVAE